MMRRNERIKRTGEYYVRCEWGSQKYYRAVLDLQVVSIRLSRVVFKTASGALAYRQRVISRLGRLRSAAVVSVAVLAETE